MLFRSQLAAAEPDIAPADAAVFLQRARLSLRRCLLSRRPDLCPQRSRADRTGAADHGGQSWRAASVARVAEFGAEPQLLPHPRDAAPARRRPVRWYFAAALHLSGPSRKDRAVDQPDPARCGRHRRPGRGGCCARRGQRRQDRLHGCVAGGWSTIGRSTGNIRRDQCKALVRNNPSQRRTIQVAPSSR